MEFDKLYESLLNELNQSTINSALLKHQSIKDKNPVAKSRAEDFSKKSKEYSTKRGKIIHTTLDPNSRSTSNYKNYYLEKANSSRSDEGVFKIKALRVDPYDDTPMGETYIMYDTNSNTLKEMRDGQQLFLHSRTDAEALAKFIRNETGVNVSWKNMDFVHSGDYSNQHANTRYDMSKLGK
jgi:hypothetical protein